jgi:hypothetical protein
VLSADTHNRIVGNGPGETLSNVNNTIAGAGTIGGGQLALVNSGTINANTAAALTIDTGGNTIVNTGLMETTAAGGLDIKSDVSNGGTLAASAGLLKLEGSVTGSGTTVIAGGGSVEIAAANGTENRRQPYRSDRLRRHQLGRRALHLFGRRRQYQRHPHRHQRGDLGEASC